MVKTMLTCCSLKVHVEKDWLRLCALLSGLNNISNKIMLVAKVFIGFMVLNRLMAVNLLMAISALMAAPNLQTTLY